MRGRLAGAWVAAVAVMNIRLCVASGMARNAAAQKKGAMPFGLGLGLEQSAVEYTLIYDAVCR